MKYFSGLAATLLLFFVCAEFTAQYRPANLSKADLKKADQWVDQSYHSLSQNEKLGQLFIVALYTNKGEDFIDNVRKTVVKEQIGGLILMQDDAAREIN